MFLVKICELTVFWSPGYKTCSTQLRLKFILLINVKMPTVVGILKFMSRINVLILQPEFFINFEYFNIYERLKFHAQLS